MPISKASSYEAILVLLNMTKLIVYKYRFQLKQIRELTRSRAFIGMIPLDPTPTGMWSNRLCVNCSLTGWTSFSSRLVRRRRTPQLISNPTPPIGKSMFKFTKVSKDNKKWLRQILRVGQWNMLPGEMTAFGSLMSNAAMLPMAKPYPEWMSGSPTERPTMPGKAATLAICLTPKI